jgi:hypothetical protein
MSFDAWIVGFGLSGVLQQLQVINGRAAYSVFVTVALFDIWLLYRFFSGAQARGLGASPARVDESSRASTYEPTRF